MTPLSAILYFGVPAILSAGCFLAIALLRLRTQREGEAPLPLALRLLPPVVLGVAFWPADFAWSQFHPVWDKDGTQRFLAIAIAAGTAGVIHAAANRKLVTLVVRGLLGAGTAFIVLLPLAGTTYVPWPLLIGLAIATGLWLAAAGGVLDGADARLPRLTIPMVLVISAAASAPGLFVSGFAGGAMLAGSLGAIGFGLTVARAILRLTPQELPGGHTVWLALFASILLVTFGYVDVPAWWVLPIMAFAPLGALAAFVPRCRWRRFVAATLAAALLAGGATLATTLAVPDDESESYQGY